MMTRVLAVSGTLILFVSLYYFGIERQNELDRYAAKLQIYDRTPMTDAKGAKARVNLMHQEMKQLEKRMNTLLWMGYSGLVVGAVLLTVAFITHRRYVDRQKAREVDPAGDAGPSEQPAAGDQVLQSGESFAADQESKSSEQQAADSGEQVADDKAPGDKAADDKADSQDSGSV